jgi:DNA repair exonuclease SbcCD ATPase subunit
MSEVTQLLAKAEAQAHHWAGQRGVLEAALLKAKESQDLAGANAALLRDVAALLEHAGAAARLSLQERMEQLVTDALVMIFDDPSYRFIVEFKSRRNQVEVDFKLRHGTVEMDPMEGAGGGIVDVVALALRLLMLELLRVKGPLILDEPVKYVSADYIGNVGTFLKAYSQQTGRQVIMVTHTDALALLADRCIKVSHDGSGSRVEVS